MNAHIEDATPPSRFRLAAGPGLRVLAQGLFLLAGLAVTVLGFGRFVDVNDEMGAYRRAPACGTAAAAPGTDCVRHETGTVTAGDTDSGGEGTTYTLTVARETAPTHGYTVDSGFYYAAEVGTEVDLTVFRGRVAELSQGGHHAQNPGTPWLASAEVAFLVGLGSAFTVQGLAWSRPGPRGARSTVAALAVVPPAFLGSLVLISSQLPLAVTLAGPVLGWLVLTAVATAATRDA
ncbi:hypothetical protein [Kitasatospora camelliae]|uniref:DUF3592 domain-containing protein n=1 Tax=Kitasatospora camelliae TaxID=3156397 RepID=A0AAU8K4Z8_9ACTN